MHILNFNRYCQIYIPNHNIYNIGDPFLTPLTIEKYHQSKCLIAENCLRQLYYTHMSKLYATT